MSRHDEPSQSNERYEPSPLFSEMLDAIAKEMARRLRSQQDEGSSDSTGRAKA